MSVTSMIDRFGRDVTLRRRTFGKTAMGGTKVSGYTSNTVRLFLHAGGGSKPTRFGAERAEYGVVAYAKAGTDIIAADEFDWDGKTYRIESVRIPNERPVNDALSFVACGVSQTEGFA